MPDFIKNVWSQLAELTKSIPPARRAAIGVLAIIVLAGILGVSWLAGKPDYEVLFAGLSADDTSAITQRLSENNVQFKLASDGSAVLVPADKVLRMRLDMATAGLPSGGVVGYEIFDQSTFGMTEFVQKLNFKRALQGELARTINQFREVRSSRVHIAIPEKKLFTDKNEKPTASVVLKLTAGRSLKKEKVRAIAHLMAASVEGLTPDNVTIVDVEGNLLSAGQPADEVALLSSTQREYKVNVEKSTEKRITSMLENIVGQGKVVTRVSADINFNKSERTEKKYDPDSQVARSEQRSESKSVGESPPAGVPGTQSNIPGRESATAGKPASTANTQETTNYEINEVTSRMVEQVGNVKKLSVAVVVDGTYTQKDGAKEFSPRSTEEIGRFTSLVKAAVGFNLKRGDSVLVESAPFDMSRFDTQISEAKAVEDRQFYSMIIKYAGMGVLALALFFFVARPLIKTLTSASSELEALKAFPQTVREMETKYGVSAEEGVDYRTRVRQIMEQDPKVAAEMIRDWLRTKR